MAPSRPRSAAVARLGDAVAPLVDDGGHVKRPAKSGVNIFPATVSSPTGRSKRMSESGCDPIFASLWITLYPSLYGDDASAQIGFRGEHNCGQPPITIVSCAWRLEELDGRDARPEPLDRAYCGLGLPVAFFAPPLQDELELLDSLACQARLTHYAVLHRGDSAVLPLHESFHPLVLLTQLRLLVARPWQQLGQGRLLRRRRGELRLGVARTISVFFSSSSSSSGG